MVENGKDCDKEPALPVVPRARGQQNEGDEYDHPRHPLRDGFLVERIHRHMNGISAAPPRNARPKRDPNSERTSFSSGEHEACAERSLSASLLERTERRPISGTEGARHEATSKCPKIGRASCREKVKIS